MTDTNDPVADTIPAPKPQAPAPPATTATLDPAALQKLSVSQLISRIEQNTLAVCRHGAAYERLLKICQQAANTGILHVPSLPIFRWSTGVDGELIEIETDLSLVNREYLVHALSPLCNAHGVALKAATASGTQLCAALSEMVRG